MRNFSLFLTRLPSDGKLYEFLYCEYTGTDYDADMAALAAEPRDAAWHALCDPMVRSLNEGGVGVWRPMESVFFNE